MASAQDEPEQVATLTEVKGTVMVDKGKGFVTSKVNTVLNEGDRVIALDASSAEIKFKDDCRRRLKANNLIVTKLDPGCRAAILFVSNSITTAPLPIVHLSGIVVPLLVGSTLIVKTIAGNDDTPISGQ